MMDVEMQDFTEPSDIQFVLNLLSETAARMHLLQENRPILH